MKLDPNLELRKLPPSAVFGLAQILDFGEGWKKVMSRVRRVPTTDKPCPLKYTGEHIKLIESAATNYQRSYTEIFFEEWGTSGQIRPTISTLFELLLEVELYRAADYVAVNLLQRPPPSRPNTGPAASVDVPEFPSEEIKSFTLLPALNPPIAAPSAPCFSSLYPEFQANNVDENNSPTVTYSLTNNNEYSNDGESMRIAQEFETRPVELQEYHLSFIKHYEYDDLCKMTDNFNQETIYNGGRFLGKGGFGSVFLAVTEDNVKIAVKRLNEEEENAEVQYTNELDALSRLRHPNIIRLIGYSSGGLFKCLLFEYMSQGNLQNRLAREGEWTDPLPWQLRLKLAQGICEGISHLHSFGLIHRDIKSANILLNDDLIPKLGDFGLVRGGVLNESTQVIGTSAYMAPETFHFDISKKTDTFSFGVVLLELLTGLPPYDESRIGGDLMTYVMETCEGRIAPLLDKKAGSWSKDNEDLSEILYKIAQDCLEEKQKRPEVAEIVTRLQLLN